METADAGVIGAPPNVIVRERTLEQAKYEAMWSREQYRVVAPGESLAMQFLGVAKPREGSEVIDFGAGTGRGAVMLALMGKCRVHMVDFAINCLDDFVRDALTTQAHALDFTVHDLNKPLLLRAEYGFCTDVMEHIPENEVDAVLQNILMAAQHVFFQIATEDDVCGHLIGERLHLSVHDYSWWRAKFEALECKIHWSENRGGACLFYLTAWTAGEDVVKAGVLNIEESKILENVRANITRGWQQAQPHLANDAELIVLCGGPSLAVNLEQIKALRVAGAGTVTLNGAYNWAIEHGLSPGATIVCDAREFNARFTHPVVDGCKYLICSQCDPAVLEGLPMERTFLWHTTAEFIRGVLEAMLPTYHLIQGGCTVLLRAIPLLRMLGFKKFHIFGADSCLQELGPGEKPGDTVYQHHAYPQPENDDMVVVPVIVGGRKFACHPWMVAQAQEFMQLITHLGDEFELEVYGDGLLAWILKHAADEDMKTEMNAALAAESDPNATSSVSTEGARDAKRVEPSTDS